MKFYWVTDNYRVNLESIFSLEKKYVDNSSAIKDWENAFQYWIDEIKEKGLHTMDYDIEILDDSNINQEDANIIYQYIISNIGEKPKEYEIEYYIILSTGIKVQLSEDKYQKINELIDQKGNEEVN